MKNSWGLFLMAALVVFAGHVLPAQAVEIACLGSSTDRLTQLRASLFEGSSTGTLMFHVESKAEPGTIITEAKGNTSLKCRLFGENLLRCLSPKDFMQFCVDIDIRTLDAWAYSVNPPSPRIGAETNLDPIAYLNCEEL